MGWIEGKEFLVNPAGPWIAAPDRGPCRPHHLDSAGLGDGGVGHEPDIHAGLERKLASVRCRRQ